MAATGLFAIGTAWIGLAVEGAPRLSVGYTCCATRDHGEVACCHLSSIALLADILL